MKIHRFIYPFSSTEKNILIQEREIVFQMNTILKLQEKEQVTLCDGVGNFVLGEIQEIDKKHVLVETITYTNSKPAKTCHAYLAILKKDNFELAVQKMTELGITDITPIITDRTIKNGLNRERLEKISKEAVEQSGQSFLPKINKELFLKEAIEQAKTCTKSVFCFDEPDKSVEIPQELDTVSFFIGPEGGWTESEKVLFKNNNVYCVSLGNTTLRGETAAIVGSFWIKERQ